MPVLLSLSNTRWESFVPQYLCAHGSWSVQVVGCSAADTDSFLPYAFSGLSCCLALFLFSLGRPVVQEDLALLNHTKNSLLLTITFSTNIYIYSIPPSHT